MKSKVTRHFLVKCRSNRGGRHLVPTSIQEIKPTPEDPVTGYVPVGSPSPYFGELREPLLKRGDLVTLPAGDRITRDPHVGKEVRRGRKGITFVQVAVSVDEWVRFTKRTNDPKLSWLLRKCQEKGLRVKVEGESRHAPISWVHRDDYYAAAGILAPVDSSPDDARKFRREA